MSTTRSLFAAILTLAAIAPASAGLVDDLAKDVAKKAVTCKAGKAAFDGSMLGSSGDAFLAKPAMDRCERDFVSRMTRDQKADYRRQVRLCGFRNDFQQGTMYRSAANSCALDVAAAFSKDIQSALRPSRASFDCLKAKSPVEKAICSDNVLSDADIILADGYAGALKTKGVDRQDLVSGERKWLADLPSACKVTDPATHKAVVCLRHAFETRFTNMDACGVSDPVTSKCLASSVPEVDSQVEEEADDKCKGKSTVFERAICSEPDSAMWDKVMSATYFKTLKDLDPTRKEFLLKEQRAWLKRQMAEKFDDDLEVESPGDEVAQALESRASTILKEFPVSGYVGEDDPRLEGRKERTVDPTKPFEGYYPDFIRYRGMTSEVSQVLYQRGDRVCGVTRSWFTGRTATTAMIAKATGDAAQVLFRCKMDDSGEACEKAGGSDNPVWVAQDPASKDASILVCGSTVLFDGKTCDERHKVVGYVVHGADLSEQGDWVQKCLGDLAYPPKDAVVKGE